MQRYVWLTCLLIFGLTACEGGSGSSGFDVRSENAAIDEALVAQHCVQHESLTICPAAESTGATPSPTVAPSAATTPTPTSAPPGPTATPNGAFTPGGVPTATASPASSAATPPTPSRTPAAAATPTSTAARTATALRSATPTATATPTSSVQQVDIGIDPRVSVLCVSAQGGSCTFVLPFVPSGFPQTAIFRVAVRRVNPNAPWTIGDALTSGPTPPTFEVPVDIGAPVSLCCGTTVQAAILVFLNPPVSVPVTVDELVDTGADAAFVTEPFTVQTL